jgi:hypothetical protein
MTNDLTIANNQAALARLRAAAQASREVRLLKFTKGKYFVGDGEVAAGREFIALPDQYARGWVKFAEGKVAEQKIGLVADMSFVLPERSDLGDTDESQWETDNDGDPKDPWVFQHYLPMIDSDTNAPFTFVTNSRGGEAAIGTLLDMWLNNINRGRPLVQLATSTYKHRNKAYGRIDVPEFKVSGWTGDDNHEPPAYDGPTYDMSDETF